MSIQLNITIEDADAKGKREIIVAGAPDGEMPHIVSGDFSQLHAKLDEVYVALLKRKPQTVKVKSAEDKPKAKAKPKADQLVKDDADDEPAAEDEVESTDDTSVHVERQVITPNADADEKQLQLTLEKEETTDEEN